MAGACAAPDSAGRLVGAHPSADSASAAAAGDAEVAGGGEDVTDPLNDAGAVTDAGDEPISDGADPEAAVDGADDGAPAILWRAVSGILHGCAWRLHGDVFCWGANMKGQLGDGTTAGHSTPRLVPGLSDAVKVVVGAGAPDLTGHTCALDGAGVVYCFGANSTGQLGDGTTLDRPTPATVGDLPPVVSLSSGAQHTCALTGSGDVYCWGRNSGGQLGDGTLIDRPSPTRTLNVSDAIDIAAGSFHSCALLRNGTVLCWGPNAYGEIGDDSSLASPIPSAVVGIEDAIEVAAGSFHSCARHANGEISCWGSDQYGELGNGAILAESRKPLPVQGLPEQAIELASGSGLCARIMSQSVWCWGGQYDAQDKYVLSNIALPVSGAARTISIAGSCAVLSDGQPVCWGSNQYGQLGNGTMMDSGGAVPVVGLPL